MEFYFLKLHNDLYVHCTVHHICQCKITSFFQVLVMQICKFELFFMFSFSVMPIQVMCSMTVPSPLDRGFVSIVSLLSSSPTDRRVKYRCVPNPDNSVSIQRWPKHEIPTLLTFSGVFFLGGGGIVFRHRNYL